MIRSYDPALLNRLSGASTFDRSSLNHSNQAVIKVNLIKSDSIRDQWENLFEKKPMQSKNNREMVN